MTRRFWLLVALTAPVFLLAMGPHLFGWQLPSPWGRMAGWVEAVLASVVVIWGGAPFFKRGWNSLKPWSPNMYTLIALGTGVAWVYSAVAFLLPAIFPPSFRDTHGHVAVYFESAAVIVTLVTLGDFLELRARRRTGAALKALLGLAPKTAHRLDAAGQRERRATGRGAARRHAARAAGRKSAGRRRGAGGRESCRRIDAHRRADAGGQDPG